MEAIRAQIGVVTDELNMLKQEIVQVKDIHASLHQTTVEANGATARSFAEFRSRADLVESQIGTLRDDAKHMAPRAENHSLNLSRFR